MKQPVSPLGQMLIMVLLMLTTLGTVNAESARDDVASLVHSLGYGAAIHNFKNYVLRGQTEQYLAAKQSYSDALRNLSRLEKRSETQHQDRLAIASIRTMIGAYKTGLERVSDLRIKGWRLEDIDQAVTVDDTEAIAALDQLRGRWQWSELEEIEYQLGYGKGVHNFKNYVLRQHERYHTLALENFLAVESLIVNQFNTTRLNSEQRTALEKIGRVAQSYRNYLSLVGRLHAAQRTERQIDLAVKINDGPALAALSFLVR